MTKLHKHAPEHGHSHAPAAKLTPNEASVRELLTAADKPLSAYDLVSLMSKRAKHMVAPATVYRALKTLSEHGIVTRIESRNAYVLCLHPHEDHDCLFFICRSCGSATEAPDSAISSAVRQEADSLGFGINKQILEVIGLCKVCAKKSK